MSQATTQTRYPTYASLDFPAFETYIRAFWERERIFEQSLERRAHAPAFTFYEGPPSANGQPGIHHVMARTIKDIFCRYQTLKGRLVHRKAGWDTHGLPVELQVEKSLGITKKDIGTTISIADYNAACRRDVLQFKDRWDELTRLMGYWLDLDHPYITFENDYIESVWHLLKRLWDKGLLYQGYTIQPYSPAAGTGLSSHELNLPGCYREVKDTSCTAQFERSDAPGEYFLAWTTTPWTLPANAALAVGASIDYALVDTYNPYTHRRIRVWLAQDRLPAYFSAEAADLDLPAYQAGDKRIPWRIVETKRGEELAGLRYAQLLPYVQPEGDAFRVIVGDFVTTDDGTGIVHIAPTFGADDLRVARQQGIPAITVPAPDGSPMPLVDRQGRFVEQVTDFAGRYVKNYTDDPDYQSVDVDICILLKKENKAFRVEKYEHNYPHCWRTDKPILYYPLDSWFIRTTAYRERMVELNRTIRWKPESTGTGRFGQWLENLVDWNLSRSRYWGVPLPVWMNEDRTESKCIGSVAELRAELERAVGLGLMPENPLQEGRDFDLHRPYVDEWILADSQGQPMRREPDLIDVWFDSGAMPFAQWHYPFENEDIFRRSFPADFIAEGVDQTRGWFFTLHAIAVLLEDSVAFRTVIANGLVLDKHGNKMSKRLGNAVDPFETIQTYGADPTRWYMIENAPPWENLKFNIDSIGEVQRKFFGTLFNTYAFFALYANIDDFVFDDQNTVPYASRPELDRWIVSKLHSLIEAVDGYYSDYDPTRAARAIQEFTIDQLSNWYVRLARRRFWKGEMTPDKQSAYETLYECLLVVAQLMSPIAPFFAEWLYKNLTDGLREAARPHDSALALPSVHLSDWTPVDQSVRDAELEARMELAQNICSLVRSLRKRTRLNIRQPLQRILIPLTAHITRQRLEAVADLIRSEVNIKAIETATGDEGMFVRQVKPNFRTLGPKMGAKMKAAAAAIAALDAAALRKLEAAGRYPLQVEGETYEITREDVEIRTEDVPGWATASEGSLTVALDTTLTDELRAEGLARELVNRIQNLRKDLGFEVTDRIAIEMGFRPEWQNALAQFGVYIQHETLAERLDTVEGLTSDQQIEIEGVTSPIQLHLVR